jgi:membrane fusion protein, heavy metal efflux system
MSQNSNDVTTDKQSNPGTSAADQSERSVVSSVENERFERDSSSRRVLIVGGVAVFAIIAIVVLLLWSKRVPKPALVETPPTLEKKEGGKEDAHNQEGAIEVTDETAELVGIKTEPATRGEIEETLSTTGRVLVAPNSEAIIGAKVSGRAVRVLVEPGQNVRAGQTVVIVDSPQIAELRGQLNEARSRMRLAEQNRARVARSESRVAVIQAKNKLDLAQTTLEPKKRLAAIGVAAAREVNEAETEYRNAKAEYDYQSGIQVTREQQQSVSELEQARATVARLTQSLTALGATASGQGGTISVASPISGTVIDRHISMGETITEAKELMTVMNLSNVIVEARIPESQAGKVRTEQRMIARIPGSPDRAFEGYVQSVGDTVDPQSRTVQVRARVANLGTVLKHEMAVEVRLVTGGKKGALMVPATALVDDEGVKVVYVKEGNRYERRAVGVGSVTYQWAEILSGIEEGEQVVTAGAYQLRSMQKGGGEGGDDHDDH